MRARLSCVTSTYLSGNRVGEGVASTVPLHPHARWPRRPSRKSSSSKWSRIPSAKGVVSSSRVSAIPNAQFQHVALALPRAPGNARALARAPGNARALARAPGDARAGAQSTRESRNNAQGALAPQPVAGFAVRGDLRGTAFLGGIASPGIASAVVPGSASAGGRLFASLAAGSPSEMLRFNASKIDDLGGRCSGVGRFLVPRPFAYIRLRPARLFVSEQFGLEFGMVS